MNVCGIFSKAHTCVYIACFITVLIITTCNIWPVLYTISAPANLLGPGYYISSNTRESDPSANYMSGVGGRGVGRGIDCQSAGWTEYGCAPEEHIWLPIIITHLTHSSTSTKSTKWRESS